MNDLPPMSLDHDLGPAFDSARRLLSEQLERELRGLETLVGDRAAAQRTHAQAVTSGAMSRVARAVRELDAATSLSGVLDALAEGTSRDVPRVAILMIRDGQLVGRTLSGFGELDADPHVVTVDLEARDFVAHAVRRGDVVRSDADSIPDTPVFANLSRGHDAIAAPLVIGGSVVAVVYADAGAPESATVRNESGSAFWLDGIEVVTRHAARCLEALTARKSFDARRSPSLPRVLAPRVERPSAAAS